MSERITEIQAYELLSNAAWRIEGDFRRVEGALRRIHDAPAAKRRSLVRIRREATDKLCREAVNSGLVTGIVSSLAAMLMQRLLALVAPAVWAAIKRHVQEIMDRLEREFFQ